MTSESGDVDGSSVYMELIWRELDGEMARRFAMESRARSLLTTSLALISLASAVGVVSTNRSSVELASSILAITGTVVLLAVAVIGLLNSRLQTYAVPGIDALEDTLSGHWQESQSAARHRVASAAVGTLRSVRETNGTRAKSIGRGQWGLLLGTLLLAAASLTRVLGV